MDIPSAKPRRRFSKRSAGVWMTAIVIGAFGGVAGFLWELDRDPVMTIPTHSVPSPNAFDETARAGKLMQDTSIVNGASGVGGAVSWAAGMPAATQDRVLRDNAPTLAALRKGFAYPYVTPAVRSSSANFEYLMDDRHLARLLALEADIQAGRGNWAASAQTSLDGIELGENLPRGGVIVHLMVGVAINAIVRKPLKRSIEHLDLAETQAALRRLHTIDAGAPPLASILQEEEWSMQAGLLDMYQKPNWRADILQDGGVGTTPRDFKTRTTVALTSKRQVMNNFTKYMDGQIEDAKAHRLPIPFDYAAADPFLQVLAPVYMGTATRYNDNRTQNAFLEVQLALHAYALQHHDYPDTLAALPTTIPTDPFAYGKSLHYQKSVKSYVLYSVGPDGVDDGGKAIQDPSITNARARFAVQAQSKGDIVAGVNY